MGAALNSMSMSASYRDDSASFIDAKYRETGDFYRMSKTALSSEERLVGGYAGMQLCNIRH